LNSIHVSKEANPGRSVKSYIAHCLVRAWFFKMALQDVITKWITDTSASAATKRWIYFCTQVTCGCFDDNYRFQCLSDLRNMINEWMSWSGSPPQKRARDWLHIENSFSLFYSMREEFASKDTVSMAVLARVLLITNH